MRRKWREIIRRDELEHDAPGTKPIKITQGAIRLANICFTYNELNPNQTRLFENFSLDIKAGEKIALVGQSGSGKSTLTKLLFRFLEPQQGEITYDGTNAKSFTLESLRKQISMVAATARFIPSFRQGQYRLGCRHPRSRSC